MNWLLTAGLCLGWVILALGAGLCWQLLRQNGRMLLRVEALEKRLDEFESGEDDDPANQFSNRSLVKSKIKREGLKAGTPAPDFRLPRLDGRGELGLSDLRGRRVLLVFSSPPCGPCRALAPGLERFHRANRARQQTVNTLSSGGGEGKGEEAPSVEVVMISKGEPKENRAKVKEHDLTFPIVLQQQWEISRRYAMFATPIAYVIDEAGVIANDVAVGVESILALLNDASVQTQQRELAIH